MKTELRTLLTDLMNYDNDKALKTWINYLKEVGGLNYKNEDGNTAVLLACEHTRYEHIKLLHEAGADFFLKNNKGYNALMLVAENEDYLHSGEGKEFVEICKLLNKYCELDEKNNAGDTALILAIRNSRTPPVKWLIKAGADLELADKDGFTPLMHACSLGYESFVQELVEAGANLDCKANNGSTIKDLRLTIEVQRALRKEGENLDFMDFDK